MNYTITLRMLARGERENFEAVRRFGAKWLGGVRAAALGARVARPRKCAQMPYRLLRLGVGIEVI